MVPLRNKVHGLPASVHVRSSVPLHHQNQCPSARQQCLPSAVDFSHWYETGSPSLVPYLGPVAVEVVEGKGRAVIAKEAMEPGDLIMLASPLAIVKGRPGSYERPDAEQLVDAVMDDDALVKGPWFTSLLYDGSDKPAWPVPELTGMGGRGGGSQQEADEAASGGSQVDPVTQEGNAWGPWTWKVRSQVSDVVTFNCYGDVHDDLAAAHLRGDRPHPHIGLWGEFSMLNHRPQFMPVERRIEHLKTDYGFICTCPRCTIELDVMEQTTALAVLDLGVATESDVMEQIVGCYDELYCKVIESLVPRYSLSQRDIDSLSRVMKSQTSASSEDSTACVQPDCRAVLSEEEYKRLTDSVEVLCDVRTCLRDGLGRLEHVLKMGMLSDQSQLYVCASLYDAVELLMNCEVRLLQISSTFGATLEDLGLSSARQDGREAVYNETLKTATLNECAEESLLLHRCLACVAAVAAGSDLHVILASRYGKTNSVVAQSLIRLNKSLYEDY
eukprot:gene17504-23816_t